MGRNKPPTSAVGGDPIEHFTDEQLDVLAKLSPQHAKAVSNYRDLLYKSMQARASTRGGFAQADPLEFGKIILGAKPTAAARAKGYDSAYTPDQIRILHAVRDHQRVAIPAGHGVGKLLRLDTPVPTPAGWSTMGDLVLGDTVFDDAGQPCKVVGLSPVDLSPESMRIEFSDSTSVVACVDHQWQVWDRKARKELSRNPNHPGAKSRVVTTRELYEKQVYVTAGTRGSLTPQRLTNFSIAVASALELPPQPLPISPWLVGYWLGNGTATTGHLTTNVQDVGEVLEHLALLGYQASSRISIRPTGNAGTINPYGLKVGLRELALLGNKHVPLMYSRGSKEQRLALLQGLMDSDGYCSAQRANACEFTGAGVQGEILAHAVYDLVAGLGMIPHFSEGRAMLNGEDYGPKYRVTFTASVPVFSLSRKLSKLKFGKPQRTRREHRFITKVTPCDSVPMRCITVDSPSRCYLIGRNYLPTHNTHLLATIILWFLLGKKGSIVITTAPTFDVVKMQIWKNIHDTFTSSRIPLPGRLLDTQLDMGGKWYAIGITTNRPGAFHGHHGTRTMVVGDEAVDIAEEINDEAESMILGPEDRYILSYNPTDPTTWVKRVTDTGLWHICRVSAENHPNVIHDDPSLIPGAVTRKRVKEYEELYGGKDSPGYRARVMGQWPDTAEDTLISYDLIVRAQKFEERQSLRRDAAGANHIEERIKGGALGIDVAGEGSDLMVCWEIYDSIARVLWFSQHRDLMESVGKIVHTIRVARGRYNALAIDDTGIGAGVSSRLLELQSQASKPVHIAATSNPVDDPLLNCAIIRVNFSERPTTFAQRNIFPQFWRIKDEMWWNLRLALQRDQLGLPSDTQFLKYGFPKNSSMVAQLSAPFFENESRGIIHVYDKFSDKSERTKVLPRKSPDIAHGLILANHAYRLLRPEFAANPPKNMLELRQRNFAALIYEYKRQEIEKDSESKTILLDDEAEDNYGPDFYRFLQ